MSMHYLLVTIGTGATQLTTTRTPCKEINIQNNSAHACNIGDSTVTAPTASPSRGIRLDPTGTNSAAISHYKFGPFEAHILNVADLFVFGTNGDHLDVIYEV